MLFSDLRSALNTMTLQKLLYKLQHLGLNTSLWNWLMDFHTGKAQTVYVGRNSSRTITLNNGALEVCVFILSTHHCTSMHSSNNFIKFPDDTTVVGLIIKGEETNCISEMSRLAMWHTQNDLSLNVEDTKKIAVHFWRLQTEHAHLTINGAAMERLTSSKFLGVHITENLSWSPSWPPATEGLWKGT